MIALYPRVSTQEQAKEGYSIDEQIERLKNYCKAMGWKEYKLYVDAGYSGGDTNRPALQEMIKDIEDGKIDKVVVYKLDRLSRSQKDTLELIEDVFLSNNVDFVSMSENFDTSTPFGRAMIGILAVFAQLEREQIKERMVMGREGRAKLGKFHGGSTAPIGYDYIDGELIINEFEKMQILEIYAKYLQGSSIHSIETEFRERGIKNKYGFWERKSIKRALTNKLYCGYISFKGEWYQGLHIPIVDEETFDKASAIVSERARKYSEHGMCNGSHKTYLSGLLVCGTCGAKYSISRVKRKGIPYRYYICYSRRKTSLHMVKNPDCKNPNFRDEKLEPMIFDEIMKLALEPNTIREIKKQNKANSEIENKIHLLEKEILSIDNQRSRLMDLYAIGKYTIDEINSKTSPLNEQKENLQKEIIRLSHEQSNLSEEKAIEIVSSFKDIFDRGNFDEIRLVVDTLIDSIEIHPDGNLTIRWNFA